MRKRKVVVIGGGVAGLTAAHELSDRGFEVHLYERRNQWGGKAASAPNEWGFSGEHGFRFFPGWYRHVPDTMARIPYKARSVAENLVSASENLFASYHRDSVVAPLRFPTSVADLTRMAAAPENALKLGLTVADFLFFFGKLAEFATALERDRLEQYEAMSWWKFMEADSRSPEFRAYLVDGITRNTVAADPRQANAYTIATAALRTLTDAVRPDSPVDRVLNGPTDKVWIGPWVEHLKARGVLLARDAQLESIEFTDEAKIEGVVIRHGGLKLRCCEAHWRLLLARKREYENGGRDPQALRESAKWADYKALYDYKRVAYPELTAGVHRNVAPEDSLRAPLAEHWDDTWDEELESAQRQYREALAESERKSGLVKADYFVFALPVEQMAYQVKRSRTLRRHDPGLESILSLAGHVEWMVGIQFYLTEKLEITGGHIDCLDSEWALTAICQTQFWSEEDVEEQGDKELSGAVKTILSVDISAWNVAGSKHRKEAYRCEAPEIADEVWHQLKRSLNRENRAPILKDEYLLCHDGDREALPKESYHLDDDIIGRFDRTKQGLYKVFESVRFSSEAVAKSADEKAAADPMSVFAHGDRLTVNVEPLFVNRANTWKLRPRATTRVRNMFLAADYIQTNTNLATMEAANEAARHAVNALLTVSGSDQKPCRVWTLNAPSDVIGSLGRLLGMEGAGPEQGLIASAEVVGQAAAKAGRAARGIAQAFSGVMRKR